jgi:hypothetical protein
VLPSASIQSSCCDEVLRIERSVVVGAGWWRAMNLIQTVKVAFPSYLP